MSDADGSSGADSAYSGRLLVHDQETHLEPYGPLEVGAIVEVVRGNGPREGDRMGSATVTGFDENGAPLLEVSFD